MFVSLGLTIVTLYVVNAVVYGASSFNQTAVRSLGKFYFRYGSGLMPVPIVKSRGKFIHKKESLHKNLIFFEKNVLISHLSFHYTEKTCKMNKCFIRITSNHKDYSSQTI